MTEYTLTLEVMGKGLLNMNWDRVKVDINSEYSAETLTKRLYSVLKKELRL